MHSEKAEGPDKSRLYLFLTLALILANTLFHLWYIWKGPLDLFPDEAHYWDWSRHPDICYYSKGPMVAYVILIFTQLFGTSAFTVRLGAVALSAATAILIFHLGKLIFRSEKTGFYATAMLFLTPMANAGSFIMTIDGPFIFFWTIAILAGYRALHNQKAFWYVFGIAAGLGSLSKYTMLFLWLSVLLYLLLSRKDRFWFRRKELYLSFLVCMIVLSPVLIWNAEHDWVSFRHLMGQTKGQEGLRISPMSFLEFVGSQIGVVTPLFFLAIIYGLQKGLRDGIRQGRREYLYLFSCAAVILISYLLKSFQGKVQANWPAAGYVPAAILSVAVMREKISPTPSEGNASTSSQRARFEPFPSQGTALRRLSVAAYGMAFLAVVVIYCFGLLRLAGIRISYRKDPTARAIGWRELGQKVSQVYLDMKAKKPTFIFSDRYQTTSELAFYVVGRPQTYNVNLGRRLNQYDFWRGFEELINLDAIYVQDGDRPLPAGVREAFDRCEGESPVHIERFGLEVKTFSIFRCYNFSGFKKKLPRVSY